MGKFNKDHVFILPHTEEYRHLYGISIEELIMCLNEPDTHEGLSTGRYTAEKAFGKYRIYVYYYRTLPLQAKVDESYAIIDFIGYTAVEDLPKQKN